MSSNRASPESRIRDIQRKIRRKFTTEEKIRIVLVGLRGEESITDLCRRQGIHPTMYYKWSKAFLEAGKRQLTGDTVREAGGSGVVAQQQSAKKNLGGFGIRINLYMKYSQSEKMEIIRMVEGSILSVKKTLEEMDVPRSSFYSWYWRYLESGYEGLASRDKRRRQGFEPRFHDPESCILLDRPLLVSHSCTRGV